MSKKPEAQDIPTSELPGKIMDAINAQPEILSLEDAYDQIGQLRVLILDLQGDVAELRQSVDTVLDSLRSRMLLG